MSAQLQTSHYKMNQDLSLNTILSTDFNSSYKILPTNNSNSTNFSIRRTFSADMASPKWLQNNGFPLKKFKSSHDLQELSEEYNNHDNNNNDHDLNKGLAFEDIWKSIQADRRSFGSILSPIDNGPRSGSDPGQLPPPYVHPLARRSASSLSEKSLEICTESLGSETGSDGFSYFLSNLEESDKEHQEYKEEEEEEKEKEYYEEQVVSMKCKRSMMVPPSFPPPLPSMTNQDGGTNLHIRAHRENGRLVMEAVSVHSQNCFHAQRQDGRLLLTLNPSGKEEQDEVDCEEEEVDTRLITMRKLIINKSTWPRRTYNTTVVKTSRSENNGEFDEEEIKLRLSQTLLPRQPRVSTATTALNAYEYYWRRTNNTTPTTTVTLLNSDALSVEKDTKNNNNTKGVALAQQNVILVKASRTRGNGQYLLPFMLKRCKDHNSSYFFLHSYSIAT